MPTEVKRIDTGYRPRPFQNLLHSRLKQNNVLVCHRGFGKTVFSINEMIDRGLSCTSKKNPEFAYIAPTYGQAKRVAWDSLKQYTHNLPGYTPHEGDLRVDIKRPQFDDHVRFMLLGSENPGSIRGVHLCGAIIDEFAECDPTIWTQVINPGLRQHHGWIIFIGTPKGMNHFYDIYRLAQKWPEDWHSCKYTVKDTKLVTPKQLEQARMVMTEEEFEQEFMCSFNAALVGAYYGKEIQWLEENDRIRNVDYDPAVPVDTYWDLGISDSTAIWFIQNVAKEHHAIDYIEQSGVGLDYYVKELQKRNYVYGRHTFPHDTAARELGTGVSREETLRQLGIRPVILKRSNVMDGINGGRLILKKCWFDSVKCDKGLHSLKNYERKWNPKKKDFEDTPKHNWASHGADAWRTFAMSGNTGSDRDRNRVLPRMSDNVYDMFGG